jgi:hypothetical protein
LRDETGGINELGDFFYGREDCRRVHPGTKFASIQKRNIPLPVVFKYFAD